MAGETNVFRLVLGILLAILYDSLLIFLGSLIPRSIVGCCICYISFAITFIILIRNAILLIKKDKAKYKFNFEDKINEMKQYQKDINNFDIVYKKVKKIISKFNLYFLLILILQAVTILFGARSYVIGLVFMFISFFINIDLITSLVNKESISKSLRKDESINYPYIKNIINKCKSKFDIKDNISAIFFLGII